MDKPGGLSPQGGEGKLYVFNSLYVSYLFSVL